MMQASIAVIGGGITGLVAARRLVGAGHAVTLYESGGRLGGQVRTEQFLGHAVDVGAESLHLAGPNAQLLDELGLTDQLVTAEASFAWIWDGVKRRRLPAGMGPAGPTRMWPIVRSGALSPLGMARAGLEPLLPPTPEQHVGADTDVSVGAFIGRRFGDQVTDRLVDPVLGSLHSGDVHRLSMRAATPMLAAKATRNRSLLLGSARSGHSPPSFVTFPGGLSTLIEGLLAGTDVDVRLATPVDAIEPSGSRYRLIAAGADQRDFDGVVLALPAAPALGLLQPLLGEDAAPLGTLRTASVATVAVAWDASEAASCEALRATGILTPAKAGTLMKAATFLSTKWPHLRHPDHALLRLSAGRVGEHRVASLPDEQLVGQMVDELRRATGLTGVPIQAQVYRWPHALPQLEVGHLEKLAVVRSALAQRPALALAGAAYDGLGISSCIAAGQRGAETMIDQLALNEEAR
ncbi:MAG: protoporphyrinogen oxidase [Candidatus Microthrix subdominans]|jgi:oxygen-dependent protoporphyrinogen oxidase|nr:protoporphyrinogen oxidase [Candidatus Microthrix sp.]MBK6309505.1 protoporphyrinogen oxidase [Candidatus Microthrix sp.]MBK6970071.1 protoporphyrinogen oxidase [Candidatus Microthrix sp.]MBK9561356.1 protoporphyrinogen oxidase [Candidatus Microthrix sp.]MBP7405292.1 protoporphyrinogen oxidase [Candidatus Microthrix sp.]MBP9064787.1 protoporphyrinogen oxidase [Candidatus Microthrix sp.]